MSAWLADHCCIADSLARCAFAVARWAASRSLRRAWSAAEDDDEAPGRGVERSSTFDVVGERRDSRSVAVADDTASVAAERMAASSAWSARISC